MEREPFCDLSSEKDAFCRKLFKSRSKNVFQLLDIVFDACDKKIIDSKKYKKLITVYKLLCSTKVHQIKNFKYDDELMPMLYEAYQEIKYKTFENLKDHCYQFNEADLDKKRTKENGVKVYNIKKQDCNFLINISSLDKMGDFKNSDLKKYLYSHDEKIFKSLSFVNNQDIKLFRDLKKNIAFVYPTNIPNEYLIAISSGDAYTEYYKNTMFTPSSDCKPFFGNYKELLNQTEYYNEISVLRKSRLGKRNSKILPCAIFCNKTITEKEYSLAKELNIPIILSGTKYEHHGVMLGCDRYFYDEYTNSKHPCDVQFHLDMMEK